MSSSYSIISFVDDSVSREEVAVGLMVVGGGQSFIRFSSQRINLISKLNPALSGDVKSGVEKFVKEFNTKINTGLNIFEQDFAVDEKYLAELHKNEQGIIRFSAPEEFKQAVNKEKFDGLFQKWINKDSKKPKKSPLQSPFRKQLAKKVLAPLQEQADIRMRITRRLIPGLITSFTPDLIAVGESLYLVKALNLKTTARHYTESVVARLESLLTRLIPFAKRKIKIKGNPRIFIVVNDPGKNAALHALKEVLMRSKEFDYTVVDIIEAESITSEMQKAGVRRFSEALNQ